MSLKPGGLVAEHVDVAGGIYPDEELGRFSAAGYGGTLAAGSSPAIVVVDVTNEFCGRSPEDTGSPKSSGRSAWEAIEVLSGLLAGARQHDIPVVYTKNMARRHPAEIGAWGLKTGPQGEGSELDIVDAIAPQPEDVVIEKTKPSAFFSTPLSSYLTQLGVDTVLVTGGTTSGCVRATVVDSFSRNYRTFVVTDAVFDRSRTSHEVNLFEMQQKYAGLVPSGAVTDWFHSA